jgi:hypothetical protein
MHQYLNHGSRMLAADAYRPDEWHDFFIAVGGYPRRPYLLDAQVAVLDRRCLVTTVIPAARAKLAEASADGISRASLRVEPFRR